MVKNKKSFLRVLKILVIMYFSAYSLLYFTDVYKKSSERFVGGFVFIVPFVSSFRVSGEYGYAEYLIFIPFDGFFWVVGKKEHGVWSVDFLTNPAK
ncbi:MAG: hypothetical protein H6R19_2084 [Proteobacteria bacterium]|nr:hypothetical protein [Pseudomonadota bacterium]